MALLFLLNIVLYITCIALFSLVGISYILVCFPVIYQKIKQNDFKLISFSLIIGFILSTSILAVYYTRFYTIFIYPLILFSIPIFKLRKKEILDSFRQFDFFDNRRILIVFLIAILVFVYNFIIFYRVDGYLFYDLLFYGKLSGGLIHFGYESPSVVYGSFIEGTDLYLYHYGDLWMTGYMSELFNLPEVHCLVYITYPLLQFLLLILMISLSYKQNELVFWQLLVGIGLLYGSKLFIDIDFHNEILNSIKKYRGVPYPSFSQKLLPIYVLSVFAVVLYKSDLKKYTFIILSIIPIFYSTTIPTFAGIGFSMLLVSLLNKKYTIKYWNIDFKYPLYILFSIGFIVALTIILPFSKSIESTLKLYSFKTYIVFFIETIIKVFAEYFIIFGLLIFLMLKSRGKIIFTPLLFLSIVGILSAYLFIYIHSPGILDLDQVLTNISPVLLLIMGIEIFEVIDLKLKKIVTVCMLLCSLSNLTYFLFHQDEFGMRKGSVTFSPKFTKDVGNYIDTYHGEFISASIVTTDNIYYNQRWNFDLFNRFQDLYKSNKVCFPLEIGFLFTKNKMYNRDSHPYFQMYNDTTITNERVLNFLKKKKVTHLFIEDPNKIPKEFMSHFEMLFLDNIVEGSFWRLKKEILSKNEKSINTSKFFILE